MSNWISVNDRLPDENEMVIICLDNNKITIAEIKMGITKEERELMKCGEIKSPIEEWCRFPEGGEVETNLTPRHESFYFYDETENNSVPYGWISEYGLEKWHGQDVKYWQPLPRIPEYTQEELKEFELKAKLEEKKNEEFRKKHPQFLPYPLSPFNFSQSSKENINSQNCCCNFIINQVPTVIESESED